MHNNDRRRVIRIEKGQTLFVICPPLQPFRVFFDSKLNDLAIAECEPQDVPAIEDNAPLKYGVSNDPPLAGEVQKLVDDGHTVECATRILLGDGNCQCSKLGFTPTMPERFNRDTAQQHQQAVTQTLGPLSTLYKQEEQQPDAPRQSEEHDQALPAAQVSTAKDRPAGINTGGLGNELESDIPFDLS